MNNARIASLEDYFKNPINNHIEKPTSGPSFISRECSEGEIKHCWSPHKNEARRASHFWRSRTPVNPECRVFFSFVKPQGALNGTRYVLLYSPPFFAILDQTNEEMEMLSPTTQFYFEGRFIILSNNNTERIFSIKTDEKKLLELTKKNLTDEVYQFFLCCQLNHYVVPANFLTNPFYNQVLNQENFFIYLSKLSLTYYSEELLEDYLRAADGFVDTLVEKLLEEYFIPLEVEPTKYPDDVFIFKIILTLIDTDENMIIFKAAVEKARKAQEAFVLGYEILPFSDRTKMVLHLVYTMAERYFAGRNLGIKFINSALLKVLCRYLDDRRLSFKADQLKFLDNLGQGNLSDVLYKRYISIAQVFKDQPPTFILAKRLAYSYDSFVVMINFAWTHVVDFLEICESFHENKE